MARTAILVMASLLVLSCKSEAPTAPPPAEEAKPPEPQSKKVASATSKGGEALELTLTYQPKGAFFPLTLTAGPAGKGRAIWVSAGGAEQVRALFAAPWVLAMEPDGKERLAVSMDGGKSWRIVFEDAGEFLLCPHLSFPGSDGRPDWSKAPSAADLVAGVMETAVWGCSDLFTCKSRPLTAMPAHHTNADQELLSSPQPLEMEYALEVAGKLPLDRRLAVALVDAALGYQPKLDREKLRKLGTLAGKALSQSGPLSVEERKTLTVRVALAQQEAKKAPAEQLSPRESIAALSEAMAVPQAVGGK